MAVPKDMMTAELVAKAQDTISGCRLRSQDAERLIPELARRLEAMTEERNQLLDLTHSIDEHPEDYDGPCECRLCRSYADG